MSVAAINWVLGDNRRTPGLRGPKNAQRLVLIVIANHANEAGEAWPSNTTIEREANVSADTRRDALAWLVEHGYVTREVNAEPDTRRRRDRRTNLLTIRWDAEEQTGESPPPSPPTAPENLGSREGRFSDDLDDTPHTGTTSEPPVADAASPHPPEELTPGQRANRIMRVMFDGIKEHTGRTFTGIQPVALVQILTPLLAAGWTDDEVRVALREVYKAAAPLTRATIEAELDGRRGRRRPPGRVAQLAGLQFDASGNLLDQAPR